MQPYHTWLTLGLAVLTLSCLIATTSSPESTETTDNQSAVTLSEVVTPVTSTAQTTVAPNKIALIIAIGDYDPSTGWNSLGSKYDVPLVMATLAAQGFDTVNNVAVLRDKQATRAGITQAIQQQLVEKAQPGSIAVLHYSGHGQQVFDDNADELDGFDEAIVPYDAPERVEGSNASYTGGKHLRDDELGSLLKEVRQKIGPSGDLIVVLDACHSGTATRGELTHARGTKVKIAPKGYQPSPSRGKSEDWNEMGEGAQLSPMVVISGAGADQLNYEAQDENDNWVGSLTLAMSRTLSNAEANTSYRGLFDKVIVEMSALAPRQTPQIEGDLDRQILGGQAVPRLDYYTVKHRYDDKNITINGGQLYGIFTDAEVALYDIDTQDTTGVAPKATGQVIDSYLQESDVVLSKGLSKKEMENSWVFIRSKNFGTMRVKVKLDIRDNEEFAEALRKEFAEVSLIQIDDKSPELLIEMNTDSTRNRGKGVLQIVTSNDYRYYETKISDTGIQDSVEKITELVISYAQAAFLRKLDLKNEDIQVTFEIIPIEAEEQQRGRSIHYKETRRIPIESKMNDQGILVFNEGDFFKLRFINHGRKPAYIALLDIQPDNVINALIPNGGSPPEEYRVSARDTLELRNIFRIVPPYGTENFKLIATETPIDIRPIVTSRGRDPSQEGKDSPLEELLRESYKTKGSGSRGPESVSVPPSSGHIETLVYRIEEE
ncbi:MAG: caspase family protein [Bacteroidota bacterium]